MRLDIRAWSAPDGKSLPDNRTDIKPRGERAMPAAHPDLWLIF